MKPKAWDESFDKEFFTEQEIAESDKRAEQITAELKRDKVIKGLECHLGEKTGITPVCTICPYGKETYATRTCEGELRTDALALLEAQEPEATDAPKQDSNIGCWYDITHNYTLEQVVSALKAQEPRVMTIEEVIGSIVLGRDVTLWFEFNDSIKALNAKDIEYNDYLCDDDIPTLNEPNLKWRDNGYLDGVIVAEYNDVFRCWTSKPTEAQREAIPWN